MSKHEFTADLSATNRCVKCGLCLPHCPTFALTDNEADSPRGRISLMQSLQDPDTQWSPGLFRHLDQCLQCRACEAMCPSKVPFGELMDTTRAVLETRRRRRPLQRLARAAGFSLVASPRRLRLAAGVLRLAQAAGLLALARNTTLLPRRVRDLAGLVPPLRRTRRLPQPVAHAARGDVNLFTGCVGGTLDAQTLEDSAALLTRMGYRVKVPSRQGCCGALHRHGGDTAGALRLVRANLSAFAGNDAPILGTASGCTAFLRDYGQLHADGGDFAQRSADIIGFLAGNEAPAGLRPLPQTVAVYTPCTHRNVLKQHEAVLSVLKWIPALDVRVVNPRGGCCGAAGSYMVTEPDLSGRLREPVIDAILASGASTLLTTNIGCALHLRAGLRQRGAAIEVLHPVSLLMRQLG